MANRNTPYGAFNYIVSFDGGEAFGGFSDVSGIGTEITVAEYRNGNDKENHVRKVAGMHKVSDVTLEARHRQLEVAVRLDQGNPHATARRRKKSVTHHAARRSAGAGADLGAARRDPDEVQRPDAGRQGRRRCRDGRDRAVRRRDW